MNKCSFCKKDSIIGYIDGAIQKNVCQFHYKVKLIKDIELEEPVKPICNLCGKGICRYDSLGVVGNTALVTFICTNCKEYSTVKKNIDSYFTV
jgi:hypothetical protein